MVGPRGTITVMASRVLIVDDDVVFRGLAAQVLTASGLHVVAEAGTCAEGAAAADELRPDAALVDIGLPDGDGIALAQHLVALSWRPRVVVASSDPDATSTEAVRSFGAIGFMPKETLPDGTLAEMLTGG
jgi:DNA-binding NarL/FixJ family response regulator